MITFREVFHPFRYYDVNMSINDAITSRFEEAKDDYLLLLSDDSFSVDQLLKRCLQIAQAHINIPSDIINSFPNIQDNKWLEKILFPDILVSSLIFFRDYKDISPTNLSLVANSINQDIYEYNNIWPVRYVTISRFI